MEGILKESGWMERIGRSWKKLTAGIVSIILIILGLFVIIPIISPAQATTIGDSGENRLGFNTTFYSYWLNAGEVKFSWNGTGSWINVTDVVISSPSWYNVTETSPTSNKTTSTLGYKFYGINYAGETATSTHTISLQYASNWETLTVDGVNASSSGTWDTHGSSPYLNAIDYPTNYVSSTFPMSYPSPTWNISKSFTLSNTTYSYSSLYLVEAELTITYNSSAQYTVMGITYYDNRAWHDYQVGATWLTNQWLNTTVYFTGLLNGSTLNDFEFKFYVYNEVDYQASFAVDHVSMQIRSWTLINRMRYYIDSSVLNWSQYADTEYYGVLFGKKSKTDLENYIDSLDDANPAPYENYLNILRWSARCQKLGIKRETAIRNALGNITQIGGALPNTTKCAYAPHGDEDAFLVYDRDVLYACYYYGEKYGLGSTWNVTRACDYFYHAMTNSTDYLGFPPSNVSGLWVFSGNASETFSDRFYDENAETIGCYLVFYDLGVTSALAYAEDVWTYINIRHWSLDYHGFRYTPNANYWECEGSYFLRIIAELRYADFNIANSSRLFEDIFNRFLCDKWLSPQWQEDDNSPESIYVVIHATPMGGGYENMERRLPNTFGAWTTLLSAYLLLNETGQENMKEMLIEAWYRLYNPRASLYVGSSSLFRLADAGSGTSADTIRALTLQLITGIAPVNTSQAFPLEEMSYEYDFDVDPDLLGINVQDNTLKVSILGTGALKFIFGGNELVYNFPDDGIYNVTFTSDWTAISSMTRLGNIPSNLDFLISART